MSDAAAPITGIPWDRESGDLRSPDDHNILARIIENSFARVLLNLLCENGFINRNPDVPTVDTSTGRIQVPPSDDPIVGVIYGRCFYMGADLEISGTATGGGTDYLSSNNFTEENDFWNEGWIIFTGGANAGTATQISDYDSSQKTVTFDSVANPVQSGDTFVATFFYIQDLTNGAENWVFGRPMGRTTRDGLIQWVANTTGSKAEGDILAAKVTLDAGGNVVHVDNHPTGHDRNLWYGAGAVHRISFSGGVYGLLPGAYTDVTISHDDLILLGPITGPDGADAIEVSPTSCSVEPIEYWRQGSFTLRITNNGSYPTNVTYSGERWGRKKVVL